MWCIPPKANAAFVCQMEDVLEVYKLPYDPHRPLICMDEMPKQLLADQQDPLSCQAGKPAKQDYGYKRNGVADLFMLFEPLQGKRFVEVTEKRRKVEWATVMKQVSDMLYPQAEKIMLSWTISTHIRLRLSMKSLCQKKLDVSWNDLNSTLHLSMVAG